MPALVAITKTMDELIAIEEKYPYHQTHVHVENDPFTGKTKETYSTVIRL
jgi:hypothetical protein